MILVKMKNIAQEYLGKDVNIIQYISESENQFNKRLEYIRNVEKSKLEWKEALRLSKIWHCIKFKDCKYSQELYNYVISFD